MVRMQKAHSDKSGERVGGTAVHTPIARQNARWTLERGEGAGSRALLDPT